MWVTQLGGHKELELVVVLDNRVTNLDVLRGTTRCDLLLQKWLNSRVKLLMNIFHHDGAANLDAGFQVFEVVLVAELEDLDALLGLLVHSLDPLVGLALWVDVQRPSARFERDDGIFDREGIGWKTIDIPVLDLHGIAKCLCQGEGARVGNLLILAVLDPSLDELISVNRIESSKIGNHA